MALSAGTRLGPYEVTATLGAGGMGEVYRARDTRLNRDVAVKVLPADFASDPDRRARFEREAQAIAALSHPNILAIHDIGTHAATPGDAAQMFVVTELLEGETLRERLAGAPGRSPGAPGRRAAGAPGLQPRETPAGSRPAGAEAPALHPDDPARHREDRALHREDPALFRAGAPGLQPRGTPAGAEAPALHPDDPARHREDRALHREDPTLRREDPALFRAGAPGLQPRGTSLPVRKAVDVAVQVARGLAAAHDKSLVHRDLKPENVFLLADGQVKILDFGLARQAASNSDATETATALTDPGVVMGTVGYMAPEQVRGQAVDARTDLFALGAVLYEMLTGRRAFQGDTAADTMFAIVKEDPPDLATARADLPPALDRIVRHCLEKNPAERFQSARDVAFALEALSGSGGSRSDARVQIESAPPRPALWRSLRALAAPPALIAMLLLVAGGWALGRWQASAPAASSEWIPEDLGGPEQAFRPRIASSGDDLAFAAMVDGQTQVALMKPGTGNWQILTTDRTRGLVTDLSWSRDRTKVFFARIFELPQGVYSVPVPAGRETLVIENAAGGLELADGSLIVVPAAGDVPQLHRFRQDTGVLEPLDARLPRQNASNVALAPDGRQVVFFGRPASRPDTPDHVWALHVDTGALRRLAPDVEFRQRRWEVPVVPLAVTPDSRLLLFPLDSGDAYRVVAVPLDGSAGLETLFTTMAPVETLDVGPDGSVYVDQVRDLAAVARYRPGGRTDRTNIVNLVETVLPLPDGRVLAVIQNGGRMRVMALTEGHSPVPFVPATAEETRNPMTTVGRETVALVLGSPPNRQVALVRMADGRVLGRVPEIDGNTVTSLAGSPADAGRLFYVIEDAVWSVSIDGGTPKKIRDGDSVAVSPDATYLIIKLRDRLFRVPLDGSPETEIPVPLPLRLVTRGDQLGPNAIAPDGRILVRVVSPASWFWPAGILDPRLGRLQPLAPEFDSDDWMPSWTADGDVVSASYRVESRLWRFRPAPGR